MSNHSSRLEKAARTEALILDALEELVELEGWDSVSVARIARRANLSVGAIYSRTENHLELANTLWTSRLKTHMEECLELLVLSARTGDPEELKKAFSQFENPTAKSLISLELLLASLFQPDLQEVIGEDFTRLLRNHIRIDSATEQDRHHSAVNMLVFSFAFGRLLALRTCPLPPLADEDAKVIAAYYRSTPRSVKAPPVEVITRRAATSERLTSKQIEAMLDRLEKSGYVGATISRLARSAGLSPGELFGRFGSKESLVAEICKPAILPPGEVFFDYVARSGDANKANVRARFMQDFLSEGHRGDWRLTLELARASNTVPALANFKTPADNLQRTHSGVMLMATFFDEPLNQLPYLGPFSSGVAT